MLQEANNNGINEVQKNWGILKNKKERLLSSKKT